MTTPKLTLTDKRQLHFTCAAVDARKVTKALFAESQLYKTNVYVLGNIIWFGLCRYKKKTP